VLLIIIGSGRAFQQKITIETYFNESVQGLDIARSQVPRRRDR